MEHGKRSCTHCHQSFIPTRNPDQHYCSEQACQNARKREWRRQKRGSDPDYHANQQASNQRWQKCHPDYWRRYRAAHPDYRKRNLEQTRLRKQKQRGLEMAPQGDASPFAKSDAFHLAKPLQNKVVSGTYRLIPMAHSEFAKSDALIVTLDVFTGAAA